MLVSVVIPSYNHRDYVIQAIESVLDQSWPQVDLIVIDDGSKDCSPEAIQKLLDRRGGFRFIARNNLGLLKTLNQGLHLARGEFFCELASDDYFPPDSIEKRARYLLDHPECVAVFGDGWLVDGDRLTQERFLLDKHRRMFASDDPIPSMLNGVHPVFSSGIIRRDELIAVGSFDAELFRYYEDLDTPYRLLKRGRLGLLDEPVICRRSHETNVSRTTKHIRTEKLLLYDKLLVDEFFAPYRRDLRKKAQREYLKLGRLIFSGVVSSRDQEVFNSLGKYGYSGPRAFYYRVYERCKRKFGREKNECEH